MKYKNLVKNIKNKPIKQILTENKKRLYFCIIIFILFVILGSIYSESVINSELYGILQKKMEGIPTHKLLKLVSSLIISNVLANLSSILFAIIGLPVLFIIINPLLIGGVLTNFSAELGLMGLIISILALIPHGIFEIPAMFLTAAISLNILLVFIRVLFKRKRFFDLIQAYMDAFKLFLLVIVPLLIIAGIIEGTLIYFV